MELNEVMREANLEWGVLVVQMLVGTVISLGIQAVICYFARKYMDAIPENFHAFPSWQVWLTMIPLFGVIWNFFVFPRIASSYQALFEYYGVHDTGDSGRGLTIAYCVLSLPVISCCGGIIALVLIIIYLVKTADLCKQAQWVVHEAWEAHQQSQGMESEAE